MEAVQEKIRLKKKGFPRDVDIGFTFPGVNPNTIKEQVELKKKEARLAKQRDSESSSTATSAAKQTPDPPKMKIGAIAANGTIGVSFNQDMFAPDAINQRVY